MVTACRQTVATENNSATEVSTSGSVLTLTLSLVARLFPSFSIPLAVLLYKAHLHNFIFLHSLSFSCLPRKLFFNRSYALVARRPAGRYPQNLEAQIRQLHDRKRNIGIFEEKI